MLVKIIFIIWRTRKEGKAPKYFPIIFTTYSSSTYTGWKTNHVFLYDIESLNVIVISKQMPRSYIIGKRYLIIGILMQILNLLSEILHQHIWKIKLIKSQLPVMSWENITIPKFFIYENRTRSLWSYPWGICVDILYSLYLYIVNCNKNYFTLISPLLLPWH